MKFFTASRNSLQMDKTVIKKSKHRLIIGILLVIAVATQIISFVLVAQMMGAEFY